MSVYIKISEAARIMKVSHQSARRAMLKADVPFHLVGKMYFVDRVDFEIFLASRIGYAGRGRPRLGAKKQDDARMLLERQTLSSNLGKLAEIYEVPAHDLVMKTFDGVGRIVAAILLEVKCSPTKTLDLVLVSNAAKIMSVSYHSAKRSLTNSGIVFYKVGHSPAVAQADLIMFLASRLTYSGRGRLPPATMAEPKLNSDVAEWILLRQRLEQLANYTETSPLDMMKTILDSSYLLSLSNQRSNLRTDSTALSDPGKEQTHIIKSNDRTHSSQSGK